MAEIISETRDFVLGTDLATYFEVYTVTYDNEEQDIRKTLIGPASVLVEAYADKFEQQAQSMAVNAQTVAITNKRLNEIQSDNTEIAGLAGTAPLSVILSKYQAELLTPGWTINDGTGPLPIVFTINAQGNLRYNVNGTGAKGATTLGSMLRLNNYPAAPTDTDFYISPNGNKFFDLPNAKCVIRKP